jgi:hypothetical protein
MIGALLGLVMGGQIGFALGGVVGDWMALRLGGLVGGVPARQLGWYDCPWGGMISNPVPAQ